MVEQACPHCGSNRRKFYPENPTWALPERDWIYLCPNIACITDRWNRCSMFGHVQTYSDDGVLICDRCGKDLEDWGRETESEDS